MSGVPGKVEGLGFRLRMPGYGGLGIRSLWGLRVRVSGS